MVGNETSLYRFAVVAGTTAVAEEVLASVESVFGDHITGEAHIFADFAPVYDADVYLCFASRVPELAAQVPADKIIGIQMIPTPRFCIALSAIPAEEIRWVFCNSRRSAQVIIDYCQQFGMPLSAFRFATYEDTPEPELLEILRQARCIVGVSSLVGPGRVLAERYGRYLRPDCAVVAVDRVLSPESIATINRWILDRTSTLTRALADSEDRLAKMMECLLNFDADPLANINRLTALCGQLLGADCVLYNRLDQDRLCAWGQWQAPPGFQAVDEPEGHICYDVIRAPDEGPTVIRELAMSSYAATDPNVGKFGLQTYIGKPVVFAGERVGSLCAVYARDFEPDEHALRVISSIAQAIGVEEVRLDALRVAAESEAQFHSLFSNMAEGVALSEIVTDDTGRVSDYRIMEVNKKFMEITGLGRDVVAGKLASAVYGTPQPPFLEEFSRVALGRTPACFEAYFAPLGKHFAFSVAPWKDKGFATIFADITARKQAEERLMFLSYRDTLTRVYNRTYFEAELRRLAGCSARVALVIADVDGLKVTNDTFGHEAGDRLLIRAADFIRTHFRPGDTIARIGGDEFAVILEGVTAEEIEEICVRARRELDRLQLEDECDIPLQLSIGYAISQQADTSTIELFRAADNRMYRDKLHHRLNSRQAGVKTLKQMLTERDYLTEGHAERLQDMLVNLARTIGKTESEMGELKLLAQFRDIGKVGIPDRILYKPGPLNAEERKEMQRHCEIGQRIAQASDELYPIADLILKHQEHWNGGGYPLGLKGEAIPLECRLLAIVDAYDAMTSDRPCRAALSRQTALDEIRRCAGTQFDPELAQRFIEAVDSIVTGE